MGYERNIATRRLTITACTLIKEGTTNGRDWKLYSVQAKTEHGYDVQEDLNAFEELELGGPVEFVVKKRERQGQWKVFTTYTLSVPKSRRLDSEPAREQIPLVPKGRYAVRVADDIVFVRVWRGSDNPFAQRCYLLMKAELSALDPRSLKGIAKLDGERLNYAEALNVCKAIAADPGEAAREFGARTGSCFRCSAALEVNLSRQLHMGPECMKHVYEDSERLRRTRAARAELRDAGIDPAEKYADLATV
jgi:hypothetical protein